MSTIQQYLSQITLPAEYSHKGQNGKLLIIGGSELFHAASKWSLDVASKFVDMVFYSSVPSNNELVHEAKKEFWNGIIVERKNIESYLQEADAILIGPGMERGEYTELAERTALSDDEWNHDTAAVVQYLVAKYPQKKWVIDAGALQMIHPELLNQNCIITPHASELERLIHRYSETENDTQKTALQTLLQTGCTVLLKGHVDYVYAGTEVVEITGGNPGMTKGGTGDVLAGLVAALFTQHSAVVSAVVGSYINKKSGEKLAESVGPFFNSSDLVDIIPRVLWEELQLLKK
ncbi:NAD(P)H-hydrate dehydratase [Candidatus Woesebacteria bacterium]|nr:NAD(P)H-hydrate dehydratase [Candidatus Woesebacteria bacterium]